MVDDAQATKELVEFAEKLVWKLIRKRRLGWKIQRRENAEHKLFVAGWEDWRETGNLVFARNRMTCRVFCMRDVMRPTVIIRGGCRRSPRVSARSAVVCFLNMGTLNGC